MPHLRACSLNIRGSLAARLASGPQASGHGLMQVCVTLGCRFAFPADPLRSRLEVPQT